MRNHLIPGEWNALCDECGRKFKASMLFRRWDNLMVCKDDYELRHPQDFLRVQKERIAVPFVRDEGTDQFIGSTCTVIQSQGVVGLGTVGCMRVGTIFPVGENEYNSSEVY